MGYHYEVSMGRMVPDGEEDFTIEENVREFESMSNAIVYAKRHKRYDARVFLVFSDDRCEIPLELA